MSVLIDEIAPSQPVTRELPVPRSSRDINWDSLSLSAKFAFAAAVVLCNGMVLLGGWVVAQVEKGLLENTARAEATYLTQAFAPLAGKLKADGESANAELAKEAQAIVTSTALGAHWTSLALWRGNGTIIYSTNASLTGRSFEHSSDLTSAFAGQVRTKLWDQRLLTGYRDRSGASFVRTVYTPIHDPSTNEVVAVVETADNAEKLMSELAGIRRRTWTVVGFSTLAMIGVLFLIVRKGSQTIAEQRAALEHQLREQRRLSEVNAELNLRLQNANKHGIELGEQLLKRIGSELHQGPAQNLGLALMRMHELSNKRLDKVEFDRVVDVIDCAATYALKEIKDISAGLFLPGLEKSTPEEALEFAIGAHERQTSTEVTRKISGLPAELPLPIMICMFRVVQEALNNAYRHADGRGQKVVATSRNGGLHLVVSDNGPGFAVLPQVRGSKQLGLRGIRHRVEQIGGTFTLETSEGRGTRVVVDLPIS